MCLNGFLFKKNELKLKYKERKKSCELFKGFFSLLYLILIYFFNMKPLSEVAPRLLVIQIQIQAVCTGKSTFEERREGGSFPMLNNELIIRQLLGTWLWATVYVSHCYFTRLNLKKMRPLLFCLLALLGTF